MRSIVNMVDHAVKMASPRQDAFPEIDCEDKDDGENGQVPPGFYEVDDGELAVSPTDGQATQPSSQPKNQPQPKAALEQRPKSNAASSRTTQPTSVRGLRQPQIRTKSAS